MNAPKYIHRDGVANIFESQKDRFSANNTRREDALLNFPNVGIRSLESIMFAIVTLVTRYSRRLSVLMISEVSCSTQSNVLGKANRFGKPFFSNDALPRNRFVATHPGVNFFWSTAEWSDHRANSLPLKNNDNIGEILVLNTPFAFICLYNVRDPLLGGFPIFTPISFLPSDLSQAHFLRLNSSSRVVRPIRPSEFSGRKASAVEKSGAGGISSTTVTIVRRNNLPFDDILHWSCFRKSESLIFTNSVTSYHKDCNDKNIYTINEMR